MNTNAHARAGEAAKNTGIENALAGAGPAWVKHAREIVERVARELPFFTTDDVWIAGLQKPAEPRALGGVMRDFAREGKITSSGEPPRISERPQCHRRPVAVWKSLIVGDKAAE